jgi:hypothetical protein
MPEVPNNAEMAILIALDFNVRDQPTLSCRPMWEFRNEPRVSNMYGWYGRFRPQGQMKRFLEGAALAARPWLFGAVPLIQRRPRADLTKATVDP